MTIFIQQMNKTCRFRVFRKPAAWGKYPYYETNKKAYLTTDAV